MNMLSRALRPGCLISLLVIYVIVDDVRVDAIWLVAKTTSWFKTNGLKPTHSIMIAIAKNKPK